MIRAFTLVEILISVAIVFTVGFGLLSLSGNNTKLISYAKAKNIANSELSLSLLSNTCTQSGDNIYDNIKSRFALKDDKLITALKAQNFTCESEEVLSLDLADNTELNATLGEIPQLGFTINKISASINGVNTLAYEIKAQM